MAEANAQAATRSMPRPRGSGRRWERISRIVVSALLGVTSLLIAFWAYQSSQYGGEASRLDAVANRMTIDSVAQVQRDYADHLTDVQVWLQMVASGDTSADNDLAALLSPEWQAAMRRAEAARIAFGTGDDAATAFPLDTAYWDDLLIESSATSNEVQGAYAAARDAGSVAGRLTGATVVFSAALLLLTIASAAPGSRARLAGLAVAIILIAIVSGPFVPRFAF